MEDLSPWLPNVISTGGLGLLLYLLLSRKLIHPETHRQMLAEKDRQIAKCEADVAEWKQVAHAERQARERAEDARATEAERSDTAVEAAKTAAAALDAMRVEYLRGRP
jgi:hypothetical protein